MATNERVIEVARQLARGERLHVVATGLSADQWKTVIATLISLGFQEQGRDGQVWMLGPEEQTKGQRGG